MIKKYFIQCFIYLYNRYRYRYIYISNNKKIYKIYTIYEDDEII